MPHRLAAASRGYWGILHCARTAEATDGSVDRGLLSLQQQQQQQPRFWFASSGALSCFSQNGCSVSGTPFPQDHDGEALTPSGSTYMYVTHAALII